MLVSAKEMLTKAKEGKYAVGQFNINNLEWTKAILQTAQENNSPVILGVSEGAGKYMGGWDVVVGMVNGLLKDMKITVPVALHIDHGTYEGAKAVIEAGFSSVMFDGSHYPIEENIEKTKRNYCTGQRKRHFRGSGSRCHWRRGRWRCRQRRVADPDECKMIAVWVLLCWLPVLAISMENIRPTGKGLNFEVLAKIQEKDSRRSVGIARWYRDSGRYDQKAISLGVSKINVNTECQLAFAEATRKYIEAGKRSGGQKASIPGNCWLPVRKRSKIR